MSKVKYLSENDVKSLIGDDIDIAVKGMYDAFGLMEEGDFACGGDIHSSHGMQLKYKKNGEDALYISMPGYVGGKYQISGIKWHGPMNRVLAKDTESHFVLVLNEAVSGKPICIMEANYLTTLRTAAVNIVAAEVFAKKRNCMSLGIVGPGRINTLVARGIMERMPDIRSIYVKGRGIDSIEAFRQTISEEFPEADVVCVDNVRDICEKSDIISIMTGFHFDSISEMPRVKSSWIHQNSIYICGAFAYFPDSVFTQEGNYVCDLFEMYESYQNELGFPAYTKLSNLGNKFADLVSEGRLKRDVIHNLGEIIANNDIIDEFSPVFFSSGGISVEDLIMGKIVYDKSMQEGKGVELDWN